MAFLSLEGSEICFSCSKNTGERGWEWVSEPSYDTTRGT